MSNIHDYIEKNRNELLSIYSQIYTGRELELLLDNKITDNIFNLACCYDTIITHCYYKGHVEFPIVKPQKAAKKDLKLTYELSAIILCEQAVKDGILIRKGLKYSPIDKQIIKTQELKRFGKYIIFE